MKVDLLTLCDAAVEVNGRLNVLGTIDYFWAATVPYIHAKCALALRLRTVGHLKPGKHSVRIQLVDADGYTITNDFLAKLINPFASDEDIPQVQHIIVSYEGVRFASYGPYAARVEINGEEAASLPFSVVPFARLPRRRAV